MKRFLWILLVPSIAIAQTYGEEIDALLEDYFGEAINESTSISDVTVWEGDIPEAVLEAEQQTRIERNEVTALIENEADRYENLLSEANRISADIWRLYSQQTGAKEQLQAFDIDIAVQTQALQGLEQQVGRWQNALEEITYELYTTRAAERAETNDLMRDLQRVYAKSQTVSDSAQWVALEWLLSNKTAADIQQEKRILDQIAGARRTRISALQSFGAQLSGQERKAALYRSRLARAEEEIRQKKFAVTQLAEGKANLISQLEDDEDTLRQRYSQYERQLAESSNRLEELQSEYARLNQVVASEPETGISIEEKIDVAGMFRFPLQGDIRITASFNDAEYLDFFGREHWGVDFAAAQGTSILASADGIVAEAVDNGLGYSYVILQHEDGWFTVYGHLSEINVAVNDVVQVGEVIAKSGGTPGTPGAGTMTTGPHLHFELAKDGEYVDPMLLLQ